MPCTIAAQIPETIPTREVGILAEKMLSTSEEDRLAFLRQSCRQLKLLREKEDRLKRQLNADALQKTKEFTIELEGKIAEVEVLILKPEDLLNNLPAGPYVARFDSLFSIFDFSGISNGAAASLTPVKEQLVRLKKQMYYSGKLDEWLSDREKQWVELISKNMNIIPEHIKKIMNEWKVDVQVYRMQLDQWKQALHDSKKMEQEVLNILNRLPAFRDFMSRNSELARLFGTPVGNADFPQGAPIPGLQTRASIVQELQSRLGANTFQNGGALQQQLQNGMDQLSQQQTQLNPIATIQEELSEIGHPSPLGRGEGLACLSCRGELTPKQQENASLKSKTFKQRLEFGWNLQSAMRVQDFPAVRDVGLNLGYKLNPRSVAGVGIAYKFALGESWKDIEWTHEGVGLRSFIDWRLTESGGKMFKGLWLTGGFEMNYWSRIAGDTQLKDLAWQKSGLLGVTKRIVLRKREGKFQVLWDFMNTTALPSPIQVRYGYNF